MIRFFILVAIMVIAGILSSCSHNGFMLVDGTYFDITPRGIHHASGTIFNDFSRENSSFTAKTSKKHGIAQGEASDSNLEDTIEVSRSVDKQVSGYLVDLAKESPDAAIEYLKQKSEK